MILWKETQNRSRKQQASMKTKSNRSSTKNGIMSFVGRAKSPRNSSEDDGIWQYPIPLQV